MPGPLSVGLRKRILEAVDEGTASQGEFADHFKVGVASVARRKRGDSLESTWSVRGAGPKIPDEELHQLEALVKAKPDLTLKELAVEYEEAYDVKVSHSTIARSLDRLGWTRKKRR